MALNSVLKQLWQLRVIPVVRTSTPELAETAIEWLTEAGLRTFEITLTIPGALELISKYASREDILIGVGTVTSAKQAEACLDVGAKYLVSPCVLPELPEISHQEGVPCFLGALTPTELHNAVVAGADAIKIFPVNRMGGVSYLKALTSVFPDVPLVPTGGIKTNEIIQYLNSGAACVGLGSELVNESLIRKGQREKIIQLGQQVLQQASAFSYPEIA
jgi:2-dehydro-3-deoxyphosphogluconate aldolase/(4S)-4-hydroxy-2-oxoglutarate aldolase